MTDLEYDLHMSIELDKKYFDIAKERLNYDS